MDRVSSLLLYNEEGKILLQHRDKDAPTNPLKWTFFGGHIEQGETAVEAVKRECYEELEYTLQNPKLIWQGDATSWHISLFIEQYNKTKTLTQREGDDMKWVYPQKLKEMDTVFKELPFLQTIEEHIQKEIEK